MNPATAIGFIIIGLNLISLNTHNTSLTFIPSILRLLLIIAFTITAMKLCDLLLGTPFHIDLLLFPDKLMAEPTYPNKMAPNTALNLFLLSLAVVFLHIRSHPLIIAAQVITLATAFMSLFAIIGYAYDIKPFYGVSRFTPMALSTALCLAILALSSLYTFSRVGLLRYINSDGPAGHMADILLPASILVPFGLGWLRLEGQRAGLYDVEFGAALLVVLNILTIFILICFSAYMLYGTHQKRLVAETELEYLAGHDHLTGLANRRVFVRQLERRMSLAKRRQGMPFAVYFLDLDGFKGVNDKLGHNTGDVLLTQVAAKLCECVRDSDTVARLGGDEFAILFEEINHIDEVHLLAARLLEAMPTSAQANAVEVAVGVSIGIAVSTSGYESVDDLLNAADAAMYAAKQGGKGRYELAHHVDASDKY